MPSTITPQIVTINATVTSAPSPSTLQQSGAFVSVGGTTLTVNTYQYCGTLAQVTAILSSAGNHAELTNMATTFFAQGSAVGVYILELGTASGTVATQIADLGTWITNNPNVFYAYLCPQTWDSSDASGLEALASTYSSPTGKTYFFVTSTVANCTTYVTKATFVTVPSPTAASTEFQAAAFFYQWLANNPSIAAPAAPMSFRFLYGVTSWAPNGITSGTPNATLINEVLTAYANLILSGAEGGISTATARNGMTSDGNQAMFWYTADWFLINGDLLLANAIINGSNTNAPVVYNQFGINTLLGVLNSLCRTGSSVGLALSATASATSFAAYTAAFPANYAAGIYGGLALVVTPQLGFLKIVLYFNITNFA